MPNRWSISRVQYSADCGMTTIYLALPLPTTSSSLPGSKTGQATPFSLLGLAPGGVYTARSVTRPAGGLLHHLFTLTPYEYGAVVFCCTFRRITPPSRYEAPCFVEPGLSSP